MHGFDSIFALFRVGQFAEAERHCRKRLAQAPRSPELLYLLGLAQLRQGRADAALAVLRRSLKLRPDFPDALNAMGAALEALDRPDEAAIAYRQTLRTTQTPHVWFNLGNACRRAGDADGALAAYAQAYALDPQGTPFLSALVGAKARLCDWRGLAPLVEKLQAVKDSGALDPFRSLSLPIGEAEQQTIARAHARRFTGTRLAKPAVTKGKLAIGYLSADLQRHATAHLMAEFFELHDRSRFSVSAYSLATDDGSDMRRRLVAGVDRFVDVSVLDAAAVARRIAADGIDILVDLKGYTRGARPAVMAARPAPVQVQWLGYPGTMGAPFIDYVLGDAVVLPESSQAFYDEAIVRLPTTYQVNDRQRPCPAEAPPRQAFGLPEGVPVLASFNETYKIQPALFAEWMGLLRQVEGAVLWLFSREASARDNLRREAEAHGVEAGRLIFAERIPLAEHLARYLHVDLFIDTLPYNAHTTASDALWMGCPVVTRIGDTFAGRVGASLLRAVGLERYVTTTADQYEEVALRLLRNPEERAGVRRHLATNRRSLPLFDTPAATRAVEQAYGQMWQRAVAGLPPEPFAV